MEDNEKIEKISEDDLDILDQAFKEEIRKGIDTEKSEERPESNEDEVFKSDLAENCQLDSEESSSTNAILQAIEEYEKSKEKKGKTNLPSPEPAVDKAEGERKVSYPEINEQDFEKCDSDESIFLEMLNVLTADVTLKKTAPPRFRASKDGKKSSLVDLLEGWLNDLYADDHLWQDVQESNERSPEEPTESRGTVTGEKTRNSAVKSTDSDDLLGSLFSEEWDSSGTKEVYVEKIVEVTTAKRNCPEHGEEEVEEISRQETLCVNIDGQDSLEGFLPEVDFIDFSEYEGE